MLDKPELYIFTWGYNQVFSNKFVVIKGTFTEAREKMFANFGHRWSMQYPYEKREDLENNGMTELEVKYNIE